MDKFFERKYSIELPQLQYGENKEAFEIDSSFFKEFEYSPVHEGDVQVSAAIVKYETHVDALFTFKGRIMILCDRCVEPYSHALEFQRRVIFAYDVDVELDTDEVFLINRNEPTVFMSKDFYDFIILEIPLRKVPPLETHLCSPKVLEILGLNEDGTEIGPDTETEEAVDPRWEALKKLKDKDKDKE